MVREEGGSGEGGTGGGGERESIEGEEEGEEEKSFSFSFSLSRGPKRREVRRAVGQGLTKGKREDREACESLTVDCTAAETRCPNVYAEVDYR